MRHWWKSFSVTALALLFPSRCVGCARAINPDEPLLCAACLQGMPRHTALFCPVCGNRLPDTRRTCHPQTPYLLGAASDYRYEPLRNAIYALKFSHTETVAPLLGTLLASYVTYSTIPTKNFVVASIPLSAARYRARGYNQAERIARACAATLNLPYLPHALIRTRHTVPQTDMEDHRAREANVAGCFGAPNPERVRGKKIFLVDDVATSGVTLREAVHTLKQAGARSVVCLVVAKA